MLRCTECCSDSAGHHPKVEQSGHLDTAPCGKPEYANVVNKNNSSPKGLPRLESEKNVNKPQLQLSTGTAAIGKAVDNEYVDFAQNTDTPRLMATGSL